MASRSAQGGAKVKQSTPVVVAAMVAVGCIALAAVLFVDASSDAMERLGLLFAMLGTMIAALAAALKSDIAAGRLNGSLDKRIHDAVLEANKTRRETDAN